MTEKSECIRVFVRVRPPFTSELAKESVAVEGGETIHLKYDKYDSVCRYDKVFDRNSDQDEVFKHITPLLRDALARVNCSVLAYGQTSAGMYCTRYITSAWLLTLTAYGTHRREDTHHAGPGRWDRYQGVSKQLVGDFATLCVLYLRRAEKTCDGRWRQVSSQNIIYANLQ